MNFKESPIPKIGRKNIQKDMGKKKKPALQEDIEIKLTSSSIYIKNDEKTWT